jgi:hypothetical protein
MNGLLVCVLGCVFCLTVVVVDGCGRTKEQEENSFGGAETGPIGTPDKQAECTLDPAASELIGDATVQSGMQSSAADMSIACQNAPTEPKVQKRQRVACVNGVMSVTVDGEDVGSAVPSDVLTAINQCDNAGGSVVSLSGAVQGDLKSTVEEKIAKVKIADPYYETRYQEMLAAGLTIGADSISFPGDFPQDMRKQVMDLIPLFLGQ